MSFSSFSKITLLGHCKFYTVKLWSGLSMWPSPLTWCVVGSLKTLFLLVLIFAIESRRVIVVVYLIQRWQLLVTLLIFMFESLPIVFIEVLWTFLATVIRSFAAISFIIRFWWGCTLVCLMALFLAIKIGQSFSSYVTWNFENDLLDLQWARGMLPFKFTRITTTNNISA